VTVLSTPEESAMKTAARQRRGVLCESGVRMLLSVAAGRGEPDTLECCRTWSNPRRRVPHGTGKRGGRYNGDIAGGACRSPFFFVTDFNAPTLAPVGLVPCGEKNHSESWSSLVALWGRTA